MANGYGSPISQPGPSGSYLPFGGMSDFNRQYYETNPNAGYYNMLGGQYLDRNDRMSQWAQGQYGRMYQQFLAQLGQGDPTQRAASNDPNLFWSGWLQNHGSNLEQQFQTASPAERGDQSMEAPRMRWLMSVI